MLEISDAVIANCIIDQRRVEFVLLCEDKAEATSVMLERPPVNYNEMFALNGDQFYSKPCFRSITVCDLLAVYKSLFSVHCSREECLFLVLIAQEKRWLIKLI